MILPKKPFLVVISAAISLCLLLTVVDPRNVPLPFLVLPFLLLFVILFVPFVEVLRKITRQNKYLHLIAGIIAGVPVLLLLLQSINQLTPRDFIIAIVLSIGLAWYLRRISLQAP